MENIEEFVAGPDDSGRRLDRVLRILLPGLPLSAVYGALRKKRIRVNGAKALPEDRLAEGDRIAVDRSIAECASKAAPAETGAGALSGVGGVLDPGLVVLESADLLFLSKPKGMPSHGEGGLDLLVRAALAERSKGSLAFVPGPLHRLDRNTSGLIAFPKSQAGAKAFTELLRAGGIRKRYLALLSAPGRARTPEAWRPGEERPWEDLLVRDEEGRITRLDPAGRPARARARLLLSGGAFLLALVELETGLTHQIRVQAAARGLPLAGDAKYGGPPLPGGYLLHAWRLEFRAGAPFGDLPRTLEAPLPAEARARLEASFGAQALAEALARARLD